VLTGSAVILGTRLLAWTLRLGPRLCITDLPVAIAFLNGLPNRVIRVEILPGGANETRSVSPRPLYGKN
jgi:hypothetical protein